MQLRPVFARAEACASASRASKLRRPSWLTDRIPWFPCFFTNSPNGSSRQDPDVKVASRIVSHNASDQAATAEIMEKAADELQRAQTAFHGLREHLAADERRPRGASGIDGESRTEIRHA